MHPAPRRPRLPHAREWLLAAAGLGLVVGLCWGADRYTCAGLGTDTGEIEIRDTALTNFSAARCDTLECERAEVVAHGDCVAKLELQAIRHDRYGQEIGTFVTTEGLSYSPLLRRWRVRETLSDKQLLGLPTF